MDSYQREAVWRLARSLESSGNIISIVSRWPRHLDYAKDAHIQGATSNAGRTITAMKELIECH